MYCSGKLRLAVIALLLCHVDTAKGDDHVPYKVGVSRVDITPDYPIRLNGFGGRREESEGVNQRIWAKALAIQAGDEPPVVLMTVDSLGIRESMVNEVARRLESKGVTRARLAVTFTHSHTTPKVNGASDTIFSNPIPPEHQAHIDRYTRELTDWLERAGLEALADLQPARLEWGKGKVEFSKNRRMPGGPVDHVLPILVVRAPDGKIRAIYTTYACHCVTLSHNLIGGDWAGYAQELMERKFPGITALVSIGCGSDSNPLSGVTGDKVDVAAAQGAEIADEVARVVAKGLEPVTGPISARLEYVDLPLRELPSVEALRQLAEQTTPAGYNARYQLERLERGEQLLAHIHYPVQSFVFGESLDMIFLAGEVCVDYTLRLRKELRADHIWVHGYSNDFCAYIPSERLLNEGGYGGGGEIVYFALPERFQPGLEQKIIDTIHAITPPAFKAPPGTQGVEPKSPDDSMQSFQLDPRFRIELVAAEPLVADPVAIDFAPNGKLWVAEMPDYSREVDESFEQSGRIKLLSDTDGDGKYDQSSVFLEGLRFPTGVTVWRDGILVCDAPTIFFARDTDRDGVADETRELFSGFMTHNPHARVNSLRYGLDGWAYGSSGLFAADITSFNGDQLSLNRTDFRIQPDSGAIEAAVGVTQQGRVRDDWDNWFGCDNSNLARHYPVYDHYVRRNRFAAPPAPMISMPVDAEAARLYPAGELVLFKLSGTPGRATSACGIDIYRDTLLGEDLYGNSFTCEPVHQAVHRLVLSRNNAVFRGARAEDESQREFLSSTDRWFRPVQVRTGPDGALWIVDMYRYVIEHRRWIPPETLAELDVFAGTTRGRIYRIVPRHGTARSWPKVDQLTPTELASLLDHPNGTLRDLVHQSLVWREAREAKAELRRVATASKWPAARVQALSALDELGLADRPLLLILLADPHAGVRRHAIRVAEKQASDDVELARAIAASAADPAFEVRLQSAYSLAACPAEIAAPALARLALADAREPYLVAAVQSSLTAENVAGVVRTLADAPADELLAPFLGLAVELGGGAAFAQSVEIIGAKDLERSEVWRFQGLRRLLEARERVEQVVMTERAAQLLADWTAKARETAGDTSAAESARLSAIALLGASRTDSDLESLRPLLQPTESSGVQQGALQALGHYSSPEAADALVAAWDSASPALRRIILDLLLSRSTGARKLLDAMAQGRIAQSSLDATRRQQLLQHPDEPLRALAEQVLRSGSSTSRGEVVARYTPAVRSGGDPARGQAMFQKHCAVCHKVGELGHAVGPDLTALVNKSPQYLLTAMLDPNKEVDERYQSYVAATVDGRTITGLMASETSSSVTLLEQEGKTHVLLRRDLDALRGTGKSLMPEGIEKDLTPEQVADIVALVMQLGPPPKKCPGNEPALVTAGESGKLTLLAAQAEIYGESITYETPLRNIGMWHGERERVGWQIDVPRTGEYDVWLEWACAPESADNRFRMDGLETTISASVPNTGGWDQYQEQNFGRVRIEAGRYYITVRPDGPLRRGALFDLRRVELVPVGNTQ